MIGIIEHRDAEIMALEGKLRDAVAAYGRLERSKTPPCTKCGGTGQRGMVNDPGCVDCDACGGSGSRIAQLDAENKALRAALDHSVRSSAEQERLLSRRLATAHHYYTTLLDALFPSPSQWPAMGAEKAVEEGVKRIDEWRAEVIALWSGK